MSLPQALGRRGRLPETTVSPELDRPSQLLRAIGELTFDRTGLPFPKWFMKITVIDKVPLPLNAMVSLAVTPSVTIYH